jgi:class 3 adenylate cyclase/tetratricopeptide (TPR) repeat protein
MKFCGQCAAPLACVCPSCGAANPPENKFCGQCATPLAQAAAVKFTSPGSYTPKHLAERILTSRAALEGERKQVTVLFADLKGSMELLADRDPEQARGILDPVLERMMDAVHRYEGTVNQVLGDGIMALFGAPLACEDHAVRACYAALRMQDTVQRYADDLRRAEGIALQIRVGLNSGDVVVRTIRSDLHMDYTAVGQTTHVAARMEQMALPGSILLSAETLRLAEGYVQVKGLGPLPVKGLEAPIEVYELNRAATVRSRFQAAAARGLSRFVGRETELDQLHQALERARAGHGQIVAVVGEPGVGKSRLYWEFSHSHRAQGWLVLESGSVSYGKATNYLPVIELLRSYFGVEQADDPRKIRERVTGKLLALDRQLEPCVIPILWLLDVPVDDEGWSRLDPPTRRQRILDAVKGLLLREAQVQPLMVLFEDLHWIDSETQALVDSLVESLPTARLLLLANYRPEYSHGWGSKSYYRQIQIDPLAPQSAEALLDALLGNDATLVALRRLVIERTEGNPFFMEETVRSLLETGCLAGERGAYRLTRVVESFQVPATAQAMLAARIDRLDANDKRLLQAAAVIGTDVPLELLRAVVEEPEDLLRRGLAQLQATEFLYETRLFPDLEYTFRHALTHEVTYSGLLQERRKVLHAKVVGAIERAYADRLAEHAEALARHALGGEVWDKAVDYLRQAGAKAHARGAFQEALDQFEQALEAVQRLPTTAANLRRAIDVRLDFHLPLFVLGEVPRLIQLHREAEQLARQLDDPGRLGRVSYRMGAYSWMNAQYAHTIEYAREALHMAAAARDAELRILASYILGLGHHERGEYRAAIDVLMGYLEGPDVELAKRRLGLASGSPYVLGCHRLVRCLSGLGEFERAARYADDAVRAAEAADDPPGQAWAYTARAFPMIAKGEFAQALPWLERAVQLCETKRVLLCLPAAYVNAGWTLAWLRRSTEGLSYLEQGVTASESIGTKFYSSFAYFAWAEGLLLAGRIPDAKRTADRALELAMTSGEQGNEAGILRLRAEISVCQTPPAFGPAVSLYERAKALAGELGMRPLLAHCHAGLANLSRCTGDRTEAEKHLTAALTMFREMDMRFWLERVQADSRSLS